MSVVYGKKGKSSLNQLPVESHSPKAPLDPRVRINEGQVRQVAKKIFALAEVSPDPTVSPELPPVGHPKAVDYFSAATLQQFGFWFVRDNRYDQPLIAPIVDYHIMRSFLRIGLIDVLDGGLSTKLTNRQIVSSAEEWAVRYPSYLAEELLLTLSGRSLSAANGFLFSTARKRCLEMTEPECQSCRLDPVCAQRKEFFQPVLRTTFY